MVLMPEYDGALIDKNLEKRMGLAQLSSSMVLALRRKVNIKVRQPLARIVIPVLDSEIEEMFAKVKKLVLNEVNVKEAEFIHDTEGLITKKIKPNFKTLGKKYGKFMKDISAAFAKFDQKEIARIEREGGYSFDIDGNNIRLEEGDYEITSEDMPGWLVASEGRLTVALDIVITEPLRREGTARELVNRIQNLRKECNFEVTDKIRAVVSNKTEIANALEDFSDYICSQTLCQEISLADNIDGAVAVEWENGEKISIKIERV